MCIEVCGIDKFCKSLVRIMGYRIKVKNVVQNYVQLYSHRYSTKISDSLEEHLNSSSGVVAGRILITRKC